MFNKIRKMLSEQLGIEEDKIELTSNVVTELGADSLDVVELLMVLEDEFGIEISEEKALTLTTVQDIVNLIEEIQ